MIGNGIPASYDYINAANAAVSPSTVHCRNTALSQYFRESHVLNKPKCRDCWAKFYCSGGCAAANYNMNGNLEDPYEMGCELQKKRLECAIYLKAAEMMEE